MAVINYKIGEKFVFNGENVTIKRIESIDTVLVEVDNTNLFHTTKVSQLKPIISDKKNFQYDLEVLNSKQKKIAKKRLEIIKHILTNPNNFELIKEIALDNNVHYTTIYRWLRRYNDQRTLTSLSNKKRNDGLFKSRLSNEVENIIEEKIDKIYLNRDRKSKKRVIREIKMECKKQNQKIPHENTILSRIKRLDNRNLENKRNGAKIGDVKYGPKLGKHEASFPLETVQIDHTLLDIILVDEKNRQPFKRPYFTLAIDIYSRLVTGFYLSFDPPGVLGTGQCIVNSILPKESWLLKHNINSEWPQWGVMKNIHLDNAKEFHSESLEKACEEYDINIIYRPIKTPHWGGHIERLMSTFSKEIHDLPGTTFSNVVMRKSYNSEKMSAMTLQELEKWLLIYITQVYNVRVHSELNTSPLNKYKDGFKIENADFPALINSRFTDERRIRLDFLPFVKRSIQNNGVVIKHIEYYDEVLAKYIKKKNGKQPQKFLFRLDPRDISIIYFYDEVMGEYFEIPYRNISLPPMSIWEYNFIVSNLKSNNIEINEEEIFKGYSRLKEIEENAIKSKKKLIRVSRQADSSQNSFKGVLQTPKSETSNHIPEIEESDEIKPFDNVTYF